MGEAFDYEGSGLELVHVSDVLDYLGEKCVEGLSSTYIYIILAGLYFNF